MQRVQNVQDLRAMLSAHSTVYLATPKGNLGALPVALALQVVAEARDMYCGVAEGSI